MELTGNEHDLDNVKLTPMRSFHILNFTTFDLRADGKLADYNEATNILYGLNSQRDSESCFVKAESIKKSSFRLRKNAGDVKIFQLDDSDY